MHHEMYTSHTCIIILVSICSWSFRIWLRLDAGMVLWVWGDFTS